MDARTHTHARMHTHTRAHAHARTHTHTHTHTHKHTETIELTCLRFQAWRLHRAVTASSAVWGLASSKEEWQPAQRLIVSRHQINVTVSRTRAWTACVSLSTRVEQRTALVGSDAKRATDSTDVIALGRVSQFYERKSSSCSDMSVFQRSNFSQVLWILSPLNCCRHFAIVHENM